MISLLVIMSDIKKASPRKSQPLLTYEKHRGKIRKFFDSVVRISKFFTNIFS